MTITENTPDQYISSLPEEYRQEVSELDQLIVASMPSVRRVMYEGKLWGGSEQRIIGYGEVTYTNSKKKEVRWFAVGLALQKNYITVFVNVVQAGQYVAERYKGKIGKAKIGKSSISFKKLSDIDLGVLKEILGKTHMLICDRDC